MKVVCDNCRAVYKVPDDKLTKAVNKATCRNCGHRMLIPRPKPNSDPEERTLVTAVAPTPVGAPPRDSGQDDVRMGTPMSSASRETPMQSQTHSTPDEDFEGPDTKLSAVNPSEQITARESQRAARSLPPSSAPPARLPPKRTSAPSQPPAPVSTGGTGSQRRTPPPSRTPAPLPSRTSGGSRPAMYDPAGDLNWALLGTATALIGSFLLAFLSVWNEGTVGVLVMWFGLAMTFGGGLLTFMVLLTGGRGRRPAQTLLSVILGFMVAVVMSSTMVATKWGAERVIDVYDIHFSNEGLTAGTSVPTGPSVASAMAPSTTAPSVGVPGTAVADATAPPAPGAPPVRQVDPPAPPDRGARPPPPAPPVRVPPNARPDPVPPPTPPSVASRTVPAPPPAPIEPEPDFTPAPAPAPPPKPEGMVTVPMEVIHVMLSSNIEIKKCFVPLLKSGALPPRIDLKFNIMPAGNAVNAQILQSAFRGSELEGCLVSVVSGITFPPTTGTGTSITYPFVLQN